jgi:hypothetical protein
MTPLPINLRHERFVPTGPLKPNLPSLQTRPQAAAARHKGTSRCGYLANAGLSCYRVRIFVIIGQPILRARF